MISVGEAKSLVNDFSDLLDSVSMPIQTACGLVLAKDHFADYDIPGFDQSSMDGYAFAYNDWKNTRQLLVKGEMAAGITDMHNLERGEACRIFTGAPLPDGADTIIMQEKVKLHNGSLEILDALIQKGNHVRKRGSEIGAGQRALAAGSCLTPAAIGFLAGIGKEKVTVYPNPRITVIITGRELRQPGQGLAFGQVYESNSFSLGAAMKRAGLEEPTVVWVDDDPALVKNAIAKGLEEHDLILLTGGISVGDYDFVLESATACGIQQIFHNVKQRPGKPLYFGKKEKQIIFGLPGNPSSVLTCFYEYVLTAINKMKGLNREGLEKKWAMMGQNFTKTTSLTHFLKGNVESEYVYPLEAQESYRMSSFAQANCLVCLPEKQQEWSVGDQVEVHLLPS
ncbi:MAG: molybdopterin molybdenumtransferase MoeA [Bacteroidetes bacterium]|nr:MAG: molybdopterin molybdenumtransferase MoeA [Bacteroidota bacterium]